MQLQKFPTLLSKIVSAKASAGKGMQQFNNSICFLRSAQDRVILTLLHLQVSLF